MRVGAPTGRLVVVDKMHRVGGAPVGRYRRVRVNWTRLVVEDDILQDGPVKQEDWGRKSTRQHHTEVGEGEEKSECKAREDREYFGAQRTALKGSTEKTPEQQNVPVTDSMVQVWLTLFRQVERLAVAAPLCAA